MQGNILQLLREATPVFSMLQEESRQEIVCLLLEQGGLSVTEITSQINLSRPAVSHHLKLLLQVQLVSVEKQGKERIYHLNLDCVRKCLYDFVEALKDK